MRDFLIFCMIEFEETHNLVYAESNEYLLKAAARQILDLKFFACLGVIRGADSENPH